MRCLPVGLPPPIPLLPSSAARCPTGVLLTDTTLRDAHQSLLATRMRTHDMLKVRGNCAGRQVPQQQWSGIVFINWPGPLFTP